MLLVQLLYDAIYEDGGSLSPGKVVGFSLEMSTLSTVVDFFLCLQSGDLAGGRMLNPSGIDLGSIDFSN